MPVVVREFFTRWGFQTDQQKVDAFVQALDAAKGEAISAGVGAALFNSKVAALAGKVAISTVKVLKMFSAISTLKNLMIGTAAAGAGLTATFFRLTSETAKAAGKTEAYAKALGLTAEGLQEWEFALEQTGGSVNAFKNGLATLADAQLAAKEGSKAAREAFKKLNVPINQLKKAKPEELFLAVSKGIKGIKNPTELMARLIRLFGKEVAIELEPTLLKGADALKKLKEEGRDFGLILTKDDFENAKKFRAAMGQLQNTFAGFKNLLARELLPVFTEFLEAKGEFSPQDRQDIIQGIVKGARSFSKALRVVISLSQKFQKLVRGMIDTLGGFEKILAQVKVALIFFITFQVVSIVIGFIILLKGLVLVLKTTTGGLGIARAAMLAFGKATFAVFVQLVLIPAIITAIIVVILLLIEDLKVLADGGKSAIGELLQEFPVLERVIVDEWGKSVLDTFTAVTDALGEFSGDVTKLAEDLGQENALGKWLELLRKDIDRTLTSMKESFQEFVDFVSDIVPAGVGDALKGAQTFLDKSGLFEAAKPGGALDTGLGQAARAAAQTPDITGALRGTPRTFTVQGQTNTFNITQQPGESGEQFAKRVARIKAREQTGTLDTDATASVFTPVFDR